MAEKRIIIKDENIKKMRLIVTLQDHLYGEMTEKEAFNTIVNKSIENYFNSEEIQKDIQSLMK